MYKPADFGTQTAVGEHRKIKKHDVRILQTLFSGQITERQDSEVAAAKQPISI